jgi:hypothetical protein
VLEEGLALIGLSIKRGVSEGRILEEEKRITEMD